MAKKPRIPNLLDDVVEKVITPQPQGIRAYHGSPHDFDRFDLSKIGTGEGAQAYGHGLYFAESEPVAKGYRDTLSKSANNGALRRFQQAGSDIDAAIAQAQQKAAMYRAGGADHYATAVEDDLRALMKFKETGDWSPGHMYEVNIRANPENFLDWDKPIIEQSKRVKEIFEPHGLYGGSAYSDDEFRAAFGNPLAGTPYESVGAGRHLLQPLLHNIDGSKQFVDLVRQTHPDAANALVSAQQKFALGRPLAGVDAYFNAKDNGLLGHENPAEISKKLLGAGIPGIKYLDAGSRAAGDGSRNYVVFDDNLIDIIRKYGIVPGGLLGAGYAMGPSEAEAAPKVPPVKAYAPTVSDAAQAAIPQEAGPEQRSTFGKLYDAVANDPVGTFKAFGSAIGNSVKDYAQSVYNQPSKGVADALELGVTSMGGVAPQAFWMATSPTEANAGEQAILDERIRKIARQQGLLAD